MIETLFDIAYIILQNIEKKTAKITELRHETTVRAVCW